MIREAKGVAIHDLSFWSTALPLIEGLGRILHYYEEPVRPSIPVSITAAMGSTVHRDTLARLESLVETRERPDPFWGSPAERLGSSLYRYLSNLTGDADLVIERELVGCGVVTGGSCDIYWPPLLGELKLSMKPPSIRDVRQVLIYAGLLQLSGESVPPQGVVVNPRRGVSIRFEIEDVLLITGGLSLPEFGARLAAFLTGQTASM